MKLTLAQGSGFQFSSVADSVEKEELALMTVQPIANLQIRLQAGGKHGR